MILAVNLEKINFNFQNQNRIRKYLKNKNMQWNERRKNIIMNSSSISNSNSTTCTQSSHVINKNSGKKKKSIWIAIFTDLFYIKRRMFTLRHTGSFRIKVQFKSYISLSCESVANIISDCRNANETLPISKTVHGLLYIVSNIPYNLYTVKLLIP